MVGGLRFRQITHDRRLIRVERRGLEPRSLPCGGRILPVEISPRGGRREHRRPRGGSNSPHLIDNQAASPDAYGGQRTGWVVPDSNRAVLGFGQSQVHLLLTTLDETEHDVKDSNPLDGRLGGCPVTVTYVVCRLPRGAVIFTLLDARVNLSVHSFFISLSFSGRRRRESNPRPPGPSVNRPPAARIGQKGGRRRLARRSTGELQRRGWSRRESNPLPFSWELITFLFRPEAGKEREEGCCSTVELRPRRLRRDSNPQATV
jgi:hypothetical protein